MLACWAAETPPFALYTNVQRYGRLEKQQGETAYFGMRKPNSPFAPGILIIASAFPLSVSSFRFHLLLACLDKGLGIWSLQRQALAQENMLGTEA